ncbi:GNAT family N-acetyltransferase [Roseobacter sp. A03A-229]
MRHEALNLDVPRTLDHPIWAALNTFQADLGQRNGLAGMFRPEVAPFGTMGPGGATDPAALAQLIGQHPDGTVLMQADPILASAGLVAVDRAPGVQMLPTRAVDAIDGPDTCDLTPEDVPEMIDLVTLTQPGPFRRHTQVMGAYFGVKSEGRLVAMAGERLAFPGYTEISAVCVHPDHRGKGLARLLTAHVAAQIAARDEVPFLHAYASNTAAITLYESLGFSVRCMMYIARLVPAAP